MSSNITEDTEATQSKDGALVILFYRTEDVAPEKFIWLLSLFCLLEVSGITLNAIICHVMVRNKCLQKNLSNMFIFHLSVADLIFRIFAAPLALVSSLPSTEDGTFLCKASSFISATCSTAVFMSLVIIAADRYDKLVHPLKTLKTGNKSAYVALAVIWAYSAICSLSFLFTSKRRAYNELPEAKGWKFTTCGNCGVPRVCDLPQDFSGQVSSTFYFVLAFVVPLAIMSVLYTKIVTSLKRRSRQGICAKTAIKSKRNAVRMMMLVLSGFVLTWGPGIILTMLRSYMLFQDYRNILILSIFAEVARLFSSLVNPLIYAYYSPQFRQDFIGLCCRKRCSNRPFSRTGGSPGQGTSLEMQRT